MTTGNGEVTDEAYIRGLIEARAKLVRDKDVNSLLSNHATDILSFDVTNTLQNVGAEKIRELSEKWVSSYSSSIGYEIRDLDVTVGGDVAFCHYLYRVTGTLTAGGEVNMWVRATVCLRKIESKWLIVHEHQSVPFDPQTGKASLDLKP